MDILNKLREIIYNDQNRLVVLLVILLLWRLMSYNSLIIIGMIFLLWFLMNNRLMENFDKTGTVFADIGEPKYDLKGERVNFYPPEYDIPRPRYSCCRY